MENKKKWAIGYAVFCILYFAVSVAMPHDRLESRGLEGIGKPSLKLKTEAITDDTELRFEYLPDAQALSQLSFYFTADDEGVYTDGRIDITPKEIDLLKLLCEHKGMVLSRTQILDDLWGYDAPIIDRTIDTYIKNLRKKLRLDCIVTVKGVGYKYEEMP